MKGMLMRRLKPNPELEKAMADLDAFVRKTARTPLFWPK